MKTVKIDLNGYSYIFDLSSRQSCEDDLTGKLTSFRIDVTLEFKLKNIQYSYKTCFEIDKYPFLERIQTLRKKITNYSNSNITESDMASYGKEFLGNLGDINFLSLDFYFTGKEIYAENKVMFEINDEICDGFFTKKIENFNEEAGSDNDFGPPLMKFRSCHLFYEDIMKLLNQFEKLCDFPVEEDEYWNEKIYLNSDETNKKEVVFDIFRRLHINNEDGNKLYRTISMPDLDSPISAIQLSYIIFELINRGFDYLDELMINIYKLYAYDVGRDLDYYRLDGRPCFKNEIVEQDFFEILEMIESNEFKQDKYLNQFRLIIKEELKKFVKYRR